MIREKSRTTNDIEDTTSEIEDSISRSSKKITEKLEDEAEKKPQIPMIKTVDGGMTPVGRAENEVQTEKVSDRNQFKIEIEGKEIDQNKLSSSVGSTLYCYRSPEEREAFKGWFELD